MGYSHTDIQLIPGDINRKTAFKHENCIFLSQNAAIFNFPGRAPVPPYCFF